MYYIMVTSVIYEYGLSMGYISYRSDKQQWHGEQTKKLLMQLIVPWEALLRNL